MKKATKKAARAALLVLMCIIFLLTGCMKEEYKKDIDAEELATVLSEKTPTDSAWISEDQDFIKEYVEIPEYVKESHVYYAQNTNDLDEFGIFEVEEGKANAVRSMLAQGYLQKRYDENHEWYDSYMPTQTPKLRDAEVRVYGNCVAYAVLSPEKRKLFFDECEKLLKNEE
ncbi:MAG: DUF4358 domain-containing protein [Clostridia bacterium]|nr:DUF4358 domain-containing protein [Clostridia bacterium]